MYLGAKGGKNGAKQYVLPVGVGYGKSWDIEALVEIRSTYITIQLRTAESEAADYLRSRTAALYEILSHMGTGWPACWSDGKGSGDTDGGAEPARLETGTGALTSGINAGDE
jgi:hypothetical protein